MELVNELFLDALRASLQKKTVTWEETYTTEQWGQLFSLASAHRVLPMVYEAVVRSAAAQKADPQIFLPVKQQVRQQVILQTVRTDALLKLLPQLSAAGVTPLVVKGIICRELYPNPDYRTSGDEDLLIPEEQFALCHETMLACGMELADPKVNPDDYETSYLQKNGSLYIELHRQLFQSDWDFFDEMNLFFVGVHERAETITIQGTPVCTLNPTDHMFYLICHSFRHFMSCGFGIRQVCDICMYANAFGKHIDWEKIQLQCESIHAELFAAALFRIGEKYLAFHPDAACYPAGWRTLVIDEMPILEDLLLSGAYGKTSESRVHSSNVTLNAISARKYGKTYGNGLLKSIFPPAKYMRVHFDYLKKKPYLLPLAWAERIVKYSRKTTAGGAGNSTAESLRIGSKRVELLKQYGIIER